jgi:large subunit ribosomal protein L10
MTEPRPEKVAMVADLERRLRAASVVILTDYRGLTVDEIGALRRRLREAAVEYRVAKNTLFALAAERCGLADLSSLLRGPTAVVFGRDDPSIPARILQEFIRQYRKLEIKGGVIDGETLDASAVRALATLPSRAELVARTIGMIQWPLRALATVLAEPPRTLVSVLEALRARRADAEGVTAPEPAAAADAPAGEPGETDQPGQ